MARVVFAVRGGYAMPAVPTSITAAFAALADPRVDRTKT